MDIEHYDSAEMNNRTHSILLVDDSSVNLGLVVENLELQGYEVLVAQDGEEAMQRAEITLPDIILLDVMMPGMDGFEVCRRLKADQRTCDIPVIFMTSLGRQEDKIAGFAAGAVDYVTKPLQMDELRARVGAHLKLRDLQRQLKEQNQSLQDEIEQRERTEEALAAREREFRTLAENVPDPVIRYALDGRRLYVNPAVVLLSGKSAESLLASTPQDARLVSPDDADKMMACFRRVVETGEVVNDEVEHITGVGRRIVFSNRYTPEYGPNGELASILGVSRDITAIKDAQQQVSRFIANVPGFVYTFRMTPDGHRSFPFASAGIEDIYGVRPEEVADDATCIDHLYHPDDQEHRMAVLAETARSLTPLHLECRITRPGMGERWIEIRSLPEREADGSVLWHGTQMDITERKRTESMLALREQEYRSLAENLPDNIVRWDAAGRYLYVNPVHERTLGMSIDNVIGKRIDEVFPDTHTQVKESIAQVVATGQNVPFVRQNVLVNGEMQIHDVNLVPERDADGKIVNVLGIGRNMTELYRLQDDLASSEREFRSLAENSPDLILRYDRDCRRLYVNQAGYRVFGKSAQELIGSTPADGLLLVSDQNRKLMDAIRRVIDSNEMEAINIDYVAQDGKLHDYSMLLVPECDVDGQVVTVLTISRDITERKRMEDVLKFIAQGKWSNSDEEFLTALASYLGRVSGVDYVIIDKLAADPTYAETVAIYAKGNVIPNMQYNLQYTPCENVMSGGLCCYPENIQQQFPKDILLVDMGVESYIGIPLWDSKGKVIGLIALMDGKPMSDTNGLTSMLQLVTTSAAAALERNASEAALRASEEKLRTLYELSPLGIALTDMQGRYLEFNEAFRAICGYPADELKSLDYWTLTPQEYASKEDEQLKSLSRIGHYGPYEKEYRQKDGSRVAIQLNGVRVTGKDGQQYIWSIVEDITQRKRMEAALNAREREFRTLAENMPDVIVRYDRDCSRIYVNQQYARVNGIPVEAVLGKTPQELSTHTVPLAPAYQKKLQTLIESGEPFETELYWQGEDGGKVIFDLRAFPEFGPDGKVASVLTVARDISVIKRMEAELRKREREFRTLAENSPDIIVRYDCECRFVYVNPGFEKVLGLRLGELLGKQPTQIPGLPEAEFFQQRVLDVVETGNADEFEHAVPMRDGVTDWMLVSIVPELDRDGQIAYVQVLSRNITALKESQQYLEESRAQLRQLLAHQESLHEEARKKMSWDMHEDLLQILTALHMYTTMLQSSSSKMPAHIAQAIPSLMSGLDKSILLVREMVATLRPTVLNLGIIASLEWLTDEFVGQNPDMVCRLNADEAAAQMDEKSGLAVFRIVQESLAAIAKHMATARVTVTLKCIPSGYLLLMRDDSTAYSIDLSGNNNLNLYGLQERVLAMGGEMVVFSTPEHGLIIEAQLPGQEAGGGNMVL